MVRDFVGRRPRRSSGCGSRPSRRSASSTRRPSRPTPSVADARAAIAKWDAGWVAVVDADGVLRGYVDDEHTGGDGEVAERLQRIETWVPIDHDLQDTLATMLLTHEGWVSVLDGDRFVGVLTPEAVYRTLRRSLEQPPDDGR